MEWTKINMLKMFCLSLVSIAFWDNLYMKCSGFSSKFILSYFLWLVDHFLKPNSKNKNHILDFFINILLSPHCGRQPDNPTPLPRQTKCKRKTCRHCPKIDNSGKVQNHLNNRQYICDSKANCQTNNVIYLLTCDLCKKQYVGQTLNRIMDRVNHHLNDIKHRRETPISRHMQSHGTVDQYPVTIQILQRISAAPKSTKAQELRYKWETSWMAWLNSYVPNGLNIKDWI